MFKIRSAGYGKISSKMSESFSAEFHPNRRNLNSKLLNPLLLSLLILVLSSCLSPKTSLPSSSQTQTPTSISSVVILDENAYRKIKDKKTLRISEIQGSAHISPYNRKAVSDVFGVVTVKRADGFYMQSLEPDDNEKTSEGIFVFLEKPPLLEIGDWVLVSGKVDEFYPGGLETGNLSITEIEKSEVVRASSGNPLTSPIIIGNADRIPPALIIDDDQKKQFDLNDGLDFFESLESMLVQVNNAICVGPTTAYNEFAILADRGVFASGVNSRGGITITENDFNPERILVDDGLAALPTVTVGDLFPDPIVGVIDYSFGNYKLQPLKKMNVEHMSLPIREAEPANNNQLAVATFNVENLSAVDPDLRFDNLAEIIVVQLKSPDIIGLQEVQDNNGGLDDKETAADLTLGKISQFITKAGGPTYRFIDIPPQRNKDGGQPGGNIRVVFLYRTDRGLSYTGQSSGSVNEAAGFEVSSGVLQLTSNPARVDPLNYVFVDSRKSLAAEFMYNGQRIFIINNHWNSKGGDTPLFGSSQPPLLLSENQRIGQSRSIANFVDQGVKLDKDIYLIVLGDLNDFYFSKPLQELEKVGMINLFFNLPIEERYTYNYEGNSQNLDNVLVSPHLNMLIKQFEVIHINSEYSYSNRFSDHDPIRFVIQFN